MSRYRVSFRPRARFLEASAALASGEVVPRLLARLRDRSTSELEQLRAVHGPGLLALSGPRETLPWCEGLRYFGSDGASAPFLYPVDLEPDVPSSWLCSLLPGTGTRLVVPRAGGVLVVPLGAALPLTPDCLAEVR